MKNLTLLAALLICFSSQAQDAPEVNDDTTRLKTGNKTILIISNEEGDDFDWEDEAPECDSCSYIEMLPSLDFGMNGYATPSNSLTLPVSQNLMELDYSKSRSISLNFMLKGADVFKKRLYVSPGIGLNWNSYTFKNNVLISTGSDTTNFSIDTVRTYDKHKLKTAYLQIPLIVGIRMGNVEGTPFGLQFGAIGAFKIGSRVKQKYTINETNYKDKIKDDYNINPFRIDAIARMSIGDVGLYARYSLTSLFEVNKAPELYPFSVGLTIGGF